MLTPSPNPRIPDAVTGVQLMQGVGTPEARGFWADAWSQVFRRPGAVAGLIWVAFLALMAMWAPLIANGHPLLAWPATNGPFFKALSAGLQSVLARPESWKLLAFSGLWAVVWIVAPARLNRTLTITLGLLTLIPFALRIFAAFFVGVPSDDPVHAFFRPLTDYLRGVAPAGPVPFQLIVDVAVAVGLIWTAGYFRLGRGVRLLTALAIPALAGFNLLVQAGDVKGFESPLLTYLSAVDRLLLLFGTLGVPLILFGPRKLFARRAGTVLAALVIALVTILLFGLVENWITGRDPGELAQLWRARPHVAHELAVAVALPIAVLAGFVPLGSTRRYRLITVALAVTAAGFCAASAWNPPIERFNEQQRELAGEIHAIYSPVPWSPRQRFSELTRKPPLSTFGNGQDLRTPAPGEGRLFILGTDAFGADVLAQMLHACRLSISIGLVSTGIALIIGVTLGALMGYFGGWVDLILYRVVEVFMAVPVLFLLVVAASVLPAEFRTTYVMMAIIGCFTWTGMARFTRAEFLKLRNQDFVQAAQALGLPLRSVLFRHMLPNGVAPVLVDASFAIAAAITVEAILSYLGLGPIDQPSWGKLLASAVSAEGEFKWWLAVFPGVAIFITVLAYNLIGEALRDAIDPKLKKARI